MTKRNEYDASKSMADDAKRWPETDRSARLFMRDQKRRHDADRHHLLRDLDASPGEIIREGIGVLVFVMALVGACVLLYMAATFF